MARGLLEKVLSMASPGSVLHAAPWQSSGVIADGTTLVCAQACHLGGVVIFVTLPKADLAMNLWDSETTTLTGDISLVTMSFDDGAGVDWNRTRAIMFPLPGIEFRHGIVVVNSTDLSAIVYYK